jgi:hypothetical protein
MGILQSGQSGVSSGFFRFDFQFYSSFANTFSTASVRRHIMVAAQKHPHPPLSAAAKLG